MYKTILVPLDGSKRAELILPHVKDIAKHYRSNVVLLKVDEEPIRLDWDEVVDKNRYCARLENSRKESEGYLTSLGESFRKEGIESQARVAQGSVVKAILSTADEVDSDLIALASHGLSASPQMSYGSVAAGLLQSINRPLFIIRSESGGDKK